MLARKLQIERCRAVILVCDSFDDAVAKNVQDTKAKVGCATRELVNLEARAMTAPKGGKLALSEARADGFTEDFFCNSCESPFGADCEIFGCRQEDFDVCSACYSNGADWISDNGYLETLKAAQKTLEGAEKAALDAVNFSEKGLAEYAFNLEAAADIPAVISRSIAFKRGWCIAELGAATDFNKPVIMRCGKRTGRSFAPVQSAEIGAKLAYLCDIEKAECGAKYDKIRIMQDVRDSPGGPEWLNNKCRGAIAGGWALVLPEAGGRAEDICGPSAAVAAAACGEGGLLTSLLPAERGSALRLAAAGGYMQPLEMLLSVGVDVEETGQLGDSALVHAATGGHRDAVQMLLEHGADVNATNKGELGRHPAILGASSSSHWAVIQLLLEAGADPNVQTVKKTRRLGLLQPVTSKELVGSTPLHFVCYVGIGDPVEKVNLLVSRGANIDAQNDDRWTALMYACQRNHKATVDALIAAGAETRLTNRIGESALFIAIHYNFHGGDKMSSPGELAYGPVRLQSQEARMNFLATVAALLSSVSAQMDTKVKEKMSTKIKGERLANITNDDGHSPLFDLVSSAASNSVQRLLQEEDPPTETAAPHEAAKGPAFSFRKTYFQTLDMLLDHPSCKSDPNVGDLKSAKTQFTLGSAAFPLLIAVTIATGKTNATETRGSYYLDIVERLLARGASAGVQTSAGDTALHLCVNFCKSLSKETAVRNFLDNVDVQQNYISVLEALLRSGSVRINQQNQAGETALLALLRCGTPGAGKVYRALKPGHIREGVENSSEKVSQKLGASVLKEGEEITAVETRMNKDGQLRVRYERGWVGVTGGSGAVLLKEVLSAGSGTGSVKFLEGMIENVAANHTYVKMFEMLLGAGADVNLTAQEQFTNTSEEESPLMCAAVMATVNTCAPYNVDMVRTLLAAGAEHRISLETQQDLGKRWDGLCSETLGWVYLLNTLRLWLLGDQDMGSYVPGIRDEAIDMVERKLHDKLGREQAEFMLLKEAEPTLCLTRDHDPNNRGKGYLGAAGCSEDFKGIGGDYVPISDFDVFQADGGKMRYKQQSKPHYTIHWTGQEWWLSSKFGCRAPADTEIKKKLHAEHYRDCLLYRNRRDVGVRPPLDGWETFGPAEWVRTGICTDTEKWNPGCGRPLDRVADFEYRPLNYELHKKLTKDKSNQKAYIDEFMVDNVLTEAGEIAYTYDKDLLAPGELKTGSFFSRNGVFRNSAAYIAHRDELERIPVYTDDDGIEILGPHGPEPVPLFAWVPLTERPKLSIEKIPWGRNGGPTRP
eukprot:SAG11_NODE_572_length_8445_cov_7.136353_2_plen_1283_part_00